MVLFGHIGGTAGEALAGPKNWLMSSSWDGAGRTLCSRVMLADQKMKPQLRKQRSYVAGRGMQF